MAVIITGMLIHNRGKTSVALTEQDGPQSFSEEFEAHLVSIGIAKYADGNYAVPTAVATAIEDDEPPIAVVNTPEEETPPTGEITRPEYNANMKAAELREIMDECQLPFKVGMTKADMVAALDAYFDDEGEDEDELPDIGVEDPIA